MSSVPHAVDVPAQMPHGGPATREPLTRARLQELRRERVDIVGAASAEGIAVARLLLRCDFTDIHVHDSRERAVLRKAFRTVHGAYSRTEQDAIWDTLQPLFDRGHFAGEYLEGMAGAALVVVGQGWYLDPVNRAKVVAAIPAGAIVTSMSELYLALAPGPVAGITGTNGKSTTVALVEHLLAVGGVEHATAGNERSSQQFLPDIERLDPGTWALLEVSNRQLMQVEASPQVAAITALTPDHLEEHGGLDGYIAAKARIFAHQAATDIAIANADDARAAAVAEQSGAQLVRCGIGPHTAPSVTWTDTHLVATDMPRFGSVSLAGEHVLAERADLLLPGEHNLRNSAVAVAVALAMGLDPTTVAAALRSFAGKALRLEHVGDVAGVPVYSDVKSTTPEATSAALQALAPRRMVLVAGGDDKGLDYAPLGRELAASQTPVLLVPGSATDAIEAAIGSAGGSSTRVTSLEHALDMALDLAAAGQAASASPGWGVIVSPAAAGFWTTQLQGKPSVRALVTARARHDEEKP